MTGKAVSNAVLTSDKSLSLSFPYKGENWAYLVVRQRNGRSDVMVKVQKGQILCRSHSPCDINVRFDDKPPVKFSGVGSSDHDSTLVFLEPERRFLDGATKAKTILVQVPFYQNGNQIMEFSALAPLDMKRVK